MRSARSFCVRPLFDIMGLDQVDGIEAAHGKRPFLIGVDKDGQRVEPAALLLGQLLDGKKLVDFPQRGLVVAGVPDRNDAHVVLPSPGSDRCGVDLVLSAGDL